MQKLRNLALRVEAIYKDMADTFIDYQQRRQLFCRSGCGKCCMQTTVHASTLELLPLALHWHDSGVAEDKLEMLEHYNGENCIFYHSISTGQEKGYCTIYDYRGSVCRMFGAAGVQDKYGQTGLSTCQPIKQDHEQAYQDSLIAIASDPPPLMKHWKSHVSNIDYEMGRDELPLQEAAKQALIKVLMITSFGNRD